VGGLSTCAQDQSAHLGRRKRTVNGVVARSYGVVIGLAMVLEEDISLNGVDLRAVAALLLAELLTLWNKGVSSP